LHPPLAQVDRPPVPVIHVTGALVEMNQLMSSCRPILEIDFEPAGERFLIE
jgi:hypothetical protein